MIERGHGVAVWRQIEQRLADDIAAGLYPEGSRLPTEPELAERFSVNRHTLRRAMRALADKGLVRIEQGRGSFVQEHVIDYMIGRRTRFSEIISSQDLRPGGRLLRAYDLTAEAEVAEALSLQQGMPCLCLETLSEADGRPMGVATNYFPAKRFPDLIPVYAETRSISKALAHHGVGDYARQVTRVTARMPNEQEAELLKQPANRPVLVTESINVDGEGQPVQYGITRFAADRMQIVFETPQ